MLQRFRDRFGTAGLIVAVVALVAALAGTAIAAGGKLNPTQKKEVTKIAKKYAGEDGAPGAKGDKGDKGDAGAAGNNGNNGNNGSNGQNAEVSAATAGECPNGGVTLKVGGVNKGKVCNGEDGETGFTENLPEGKTETGTWSVQGAENFAGGFLVKEISFPIPVQGTLTPVFVGKNAADKTKGASEGCPGPDSNGAPTAEPATLCVYLNSETGSFSVLGFGDPNAPFGTLGVQPSGSVLVMQCTAEPCLEYGTWAVTAPTA